ncbi:unnamed protein product [Mytilus coruscus]|uniref:C2H2-type domain-containing protein n=1 Tax=Mytilus coruscus TaxID=42192 RepID=A0A6J8BKM6_MYTCO|nr:unnamed protein product [Mytilus coruscus]
MNMYNFNLCRKVYVWQHNLRRHMRTNHDSWPTDLSFSSGLLYPEVRRGNEKPFGYLLVDLKARTTESSRLRTEVLHIGKGDSATQDGQSEDDPLSDTFKDDISISSEEDIADKTKNAPSSSEDSEIREDLIACRDCGVVFAHIRGLEAHSQQGCGKKKSLLSR